MKKSLSTKKVRIDNPCRNCITRPICLSYLNYIKEEHYSIMLQFLSIKAKIADKCKPIEYILLNSGTMRVLESCIKNKIRFVIFNHETDDYHLRPEIKSLIRVYYSIETYT
jgi:hypothetical protein